MLKLITLNVETNKHWKRIIPFLRDEQADVICLQELYLEDIERLEQIGYQLAGFQPIQFHASAINPSQVGFTEGTALFSTLPFREADMEYYHVGADPLPLYNNASAEGMNASQKLGLVWATFEKNDQSYTIATTQFTWTPDGFSSPLQEKNIKPMMQLVHQHPKLILCGDFNIPRPQNALYAKLTERLIDAIPPHITCSLDMMLHRAAKHLSKDPSIAYLMVDYILHTDGYRVYGVRQVSKVSDHCAMIAQVEHRVK